MPVFLLWLSVVALMGPGLGPAQPLPNPLEVVGSTACFASGAPCLFVVTSDDPQYFLFRWDLNGDGVWDVPAQTGPPLSFDRWTTDPFVTVSPGSPYYSTTTLQVCVQGWNGLDVRVSGDVVVPDGPVACTPIVVLAKVKVTPNALSASSSGNWVTADVRLPPDVSPGQVDATTVTLNGVPAFVSKAPDPTDKSVGGADWVFRFDRGAVLAALGPGTHIVYVTGAFGDGVFGGADTITING